MYQHTQGGFRRLSDGATIPADPANVDYAECLRWIAQGNTPLPQETPNPATAALTEIVRLEREQMLPRISREFMLGTIEAQFTPLQRGANFAYVSLKAFDNQIAALRALL